MANYVDAARPKMVNSHVADGVIASFSHDVVEETIMVFLNGLLQRQGSDYTIDGTVDFSTRPNTGSKIDFYGVPDSATKPEFE